ncbi:MAG: hypothetical protein H7Y09_04280 [Chitinophagaceae bacterium]|nr:hypothetical protein [Anaerolineae bacterium]
MFKRDLLENTFSGEATPRIPVSLTRHWPGDDQRAADLARATIEFQKTYAWDFIRVIPANTYCVVDYGIQDEWQGDSSGKRTIIKYAIKRSLDWTEIRPLEPTRGEHGKVIEALRMIANGLRDEESPLLITIYSPLAQAQMLSGDELFIRNLRTHPDRLRTGLNVLTESTLRFIEALKQTDIAGIVYCIEHACFDVLSETEYAAFGLPYDQKILDSLPPRWWFNMLHLRGDTPMFGLASTYPVQAINWNDSKDRPDLVKAKALFSGTLCGGLSHLSMERGTPTAIRDAARTAITKMDNRRLILSSGDTLPAMTPLSNLRAAREIVEIAGMV